MATKKKAGSSVAALAKRKAAIKAKISLQNKKKKDAARAAKLRREIATLEGKLKTGKRAIRKR